MKGPGRGERGGVLGLVAVGVAAGLALTLVSRLPPVGRAFERLDAFSSTLPWLLLAALWVGLLAWALIRRQRGTGGAHSGGPGRGRTEP